MTQPSVVWNATGMTPTVKMIPGSVMPIEGHDVHFQTNTGLSGSVFIPTVRMGDTDFVRNAIAQRVAEMAAIHNLSG